MSRRKHAAIALVVIAAAAIAITAIMLLATNEPQPDCKSYGYTDCPSDRCAICPPCEACSSVSCNTVGFCEGMGFNRSWWETVKPK